MHAGALLGRAGRLPALLGATKAAAGLRARIPHAREPAPAQAAVPSTARLAELARRLRHAGFTAARIDELTVLADGVARLGVEDAAGADGIADPRAGRGRPVVEQ